MDAYDLCSPELQKNLIPMRDRFKIQDDKKLEDEKVNHNRYVISCCCCWFNRIFFAAQAELRTFYNE